MKPDLSIVPPGYALPQPMDWTQLRNRVNFISRHDTLRMAMQLAVRVPGNVVEFGVATGSSTRVLAREIRRARRSLFDPFGQKKLFALDSFEGLREKFENADVGTFAGEMPNIPGVIFVKGYFEETCTDELRNRVGRVAFASLDADLYSSTIFALKWLTPILETGSLLLFDEMVGENQSEARALFDWLEASGVTLVRLAEFDREPSGWSEKMDRRALYQVIREDPIPANRRLAFRVASKLRRMLKSRH
ncbi:MAG TPA: TylF/MycF/NovP-related O-methyltransferase [Micropepsaceae bacterium]|jgi:hypothetical protein|nr:TylF/MycF/NovP-related O-methyltransferase [Micropepsaceae bacterium]